MARAYPIKWSEDEAAKVVAAYLSTDPATTARARTLKAMEVLSPERRRPDSFSLREYIKAKARAVPGSTSDLFSAPPPATPETPPPAAPPPPVRTKGKGGRKPGAVNITWSPDEKDAVINHGRSLGRLGPRELRGRAKMAMNILPQNRRRALSTALLEWFKTEMERPGPPPNMPSQYLPAAEHMRDEPRAHVNGVARVTVEPGATRHTPSLAYDIDPPRSLGEQLAEVAGTFLGDALATLLTYQPVKDALRGIMATVMGKPAPAPDNMTSNFAQVPNPKRLPRVLVAGLKGHQMEEVRGALGDRFILKFWSASRSLDELRRAATDADVTIAMTNFISHSAEGVMKDRSPKYIRHSGGITNLKTRMLDLAGVLTTTTH